MRRPELQDIQRQLLRRESLSDLPRLTDETHEGLADRPGVPRKSMHNLQLASLNSSRFAWQRPTTRDKLYYLISFVRTAKIDAFQK